MNAQTPVVTPPCVPDRRFEAYAGQQNKLPLLIRDALAGLIVALVAIPLGVGFSMASGLGPEQGIIAGGIAGILGGLFGGSKYQVYGPTAAFIPLLSGIMVQYDLSFLITASVVGGLLVFLMGVLKWGEHFAKVPFSVTVGFTIGIALSIAVGQIPDAFGSLHPATAHTLEKLQVVGEVLSHPHLYAGLLALLTFVVIKYCYKTSVFIPGPLIAIILAIILSQTVFANAAIPLVSHKYGLSGDAIFKLTLPTWAFYPWWTYISPVISIMFIASLESLLSARMADRLAENKTPFNPNQELMGQGIVNILVPLLNGFPCTGAFARTATSIKAGAISPAASLFKGSFVIILMAFFTQYVSLIPMACVGGLLLYVAMNMVKKEEVRHVLKEGRLHTGLMIYTALMTFFTDLFIAVSTATVFYYLVVYWRKRTCHSSLLIAVVLSGALAFAGPMAQAAADPSGNPLALLKEGNHRFYTDHSMHPHQTHQQLLALATEQHPFVVVVGCADSRVPPEIIFDQGLGDIFDIRTAGHVLAPVVMGSLEYAVEHLHVPLIVVLGHEHCGAVEAAVHHEHPHNHVNSIIKALAPAVRKAEHQPGDRVENAVRNNVRHVLGQIASDDTIQKYIETGQVTLVGGYYHMETGEVEFIPLSEKSNTAITGKGP